MNEITLLVIIVFLWVLKRFFLEKIPEKNFISEKFRKELFEWIDSAVVAGFFALLFITFIARIYYIPTGSMEPTLKPGDFIIAIKFKYFFTNPDRGDIVVFHPPIEGEKRMFIKRVVGLPGDSVDIDYSRTLVNGKVLNEPYIKYPADYQWQVDKVPSEKYLVLGDNRPNSDDSHIWGFLPRKNIVAKAFLVIFPLNRIHYFGF